MGLHARMTAIANLREGWSRGSGTNLWTLNVCAPGFRLKAALFFDSWHGREVVGSHKLPIRSSVLLSGRRSTTTLPCSRHLGQVTRFNCSLQDKPLIDRRLHAILRITPGKRARVR